MYMHVFGAFSAMDEVKLWPSFLTALILMTSLLGPLATNNCE